MTQSIDLMWFSIDVVTMDIADVRTFCYHNDLFTQEITVFTQDLLRKLEWKKGQNAGVSAFWPFNLLGNYPVKKMKLLKKRQKFSHYLENANLQIVV